MLDVAYNQHNDKLGLWLAQEKLVMAAGPMRTEFEKLSQQLQKVMDEQAAMKRELEIQFRRIADLQADIDLIRSAWTKMGRGRDT